MIREATLNDILYIDHLRKKEGKAIGFIPIQRYEMEINKERQGRIYIYEENNDPVGFIYATFGDNVAKVQQIAVQEDARRMERASALIQEVERHGIENRNSYAISCGCATDLESINFWKALGFDDVGKRKGIWIGGDGEAAPAKSKREITLFHKIISGLYEMRINADNMRIDREVSQ